MAMVHDIHLTGGDPLVRLAWDHSTATNAAAFQSDLQMAKDYRAYLDDKPTIDGLMAAEPDSVFTAGWALTLMKARELGLDAQPANDDFRNGNDTLNGTGSADALFGGAGNDTLFGLAGNDRLIGGAGNDLLFGGPGNDAIDGGAGTDKAVFAGDFDSYTIVKLGNGVMRLAGPDGTDTLSNVEQLGFANATIIDDRADRLGDPVTAVGAATLNSATVGFLEALGDRDWLSVTLEAGHSYALELKGAASGNGNLADPYLRLHDATGALIAENDDGGGQEKLSQRPVAKMQRPGTKHEQSIVLPLQESCGLGTKPEWPLRRRAKNATAAGRKMQRRWRRGGAEKSPRWLAAKMDHNCNGSVRHRVAAQ